MPAMNAPSHARRNREPPINSLVIPGEPRVARRGKGTQVLQATRFESVIGVNCTRKRCCSDPKLRELRQSGFLPRHFATSCTPGESKSKDTRYLDIHEDNQLDEAQLAAWMKQAGQLRERM
jgi:hypothetical protein